MIGNRGAARVLVVDDDVDSAEFLAEALRAGGYSPTVLFSGSAAIAKLERQTFDAVITDLHMPEVDGLRVLEASRAFDPLRPVIIVTACEAPASAIKAHDNGVFQYVSKPLRVESVLKVLSRALSADEGNLQRSRAPTFFV